MLNLLKLIFTWWNGATMGTHWTIWRAGQFVAKDEFGNKYYEERKARPGLIRRRWVVYNGLAEASKVPPEWNGWLHHTIKEAPSSAPAEVKPWQKPHLPNLTGTDLAMRPQGSLAESGVRPPATGDYQAWSPENS